MDALELTEKRVRPRKADISVESVTLVWLPWRVAADAPPEALFGLTGRGSPTRVASM